MNQYSYPLEILREPLLDSKKKLKVEGACFNKDISTRILMEKCFDKRELKNSTEKLSSHEKFKKEVSEIKNPRIDRKSYIKLSKEDTDKLHQNFVENNYPSLEEMKTLARDFGVNLLKIENWYKHHRRSLAKKGHFSIKAKKHFNVKELNYLTEYFAKNQHPTQEEIQRISVDVNCTEMQVKNWFFNRRKKSKRSQDENLINSIKVTCSSKSILSIQNKNLSASSEDDDSKEADSSAQGFADLFCSKNTEPLNQGDLDLSPIIAIKNNGEMQSLARKLYESQMINIKSQKEALKVLPPTQLPSFKDLQYYYHEGTSQAFHNQLSNMMNEYFREQEKIYMINQNMIRDKVFHSDVESFCLWRTLLKDHSFLKHSNNLNYHHKYSDKDISDWTISKIVLPNYQHFSSSYELPVNKNHRETIHPFKNPSLNCNTTFGFFSK